MPRCLHRHQIPFHLSFALFLFAVERESAEQNLLPEPDPEYTDEKIVLKFTVAGSIKLKRTFRSKNPVTVSVSRT